ncbi:MAG: SMP-30/gluconolactonase/LRE family protein [Terriglobales bacterium]
MKLEQSPVSVRNLGRWTTWLALGALAFSLVPQAHAGKDKKKKEQVQPSPVAANKPEKAPVDRTKIDLSKLVWPAPPDIARIHMLAEILGEKVQKDPAPAAAAQPKKKPKQSWMDRLAGVAPAQEQATTVQGIKKHHKLLNPYGLAVDSKGRIYVADSGVDAVMIFDQEHDSFSLYRNGAANFHFRNVIGLAVDDTDRLFISDPDQHQITVVSPQGQVETVFGNGRELGRPTGLAIDNENRLLYVADTEHEQIAVYDADTYTRIRTIGKPSKDGDDCSGCFAKPTNVAVDDEGNLYVSDTLNWRVQMFDADGDFIGMFGEHGAEPGMMAKPKGIAVDHDGHIWVVDGEQNRVQIFDKEGHLLAYFGGDGTWPGQFSLPTGICIDKNNRVLVSDQLLGRVQVFRYLTDAEAAAAKADRDKAKTASKSTPEPQTAEVKK